MSNLGFLFLATSSVVVTACWANPVATSGTSSGAPQGTSREASVTGSAAGSPSGAMSGVTTGAATDAVASAPPDVLDAATQADAFSNDGDAPDDAGDADALPGWQLTWSDEFDGPAGTKPDPTKWAYDLGGGGWGGDQLQVYTSDAANVSMDGNGNLAIVAINENGYTSGRIRTEGKFQQAYGRFEARIRLTFGTGLWPAFWMLGANIGSVGWPTCGEMDIMENKGFERSINRSSLHGPGYSGDMPLTASYTLPDGAVFSDDFHVFAMEWEVNVIRFYVDNQLFETRTPADVPAGDKWVFDHQAFILLNVAVGGNFAGNPNGSTVFPQTMWVDYVRVYSRPSGM